MNRDEVVALYRGGESLIAIANRFGVSNSTVRNRLIKWGIPRRRAGSRPVAFDVDRAIALYRSGAPASEVGSDQGVSAWYAIKALREAGEPVVSRIHRPDVDTNSLLEMYRTGMSMEDIGRAVGMTPGKVSMRLRGHVLSRPCADCGGDVMKGPKRPRQRCESCFYEHRRNQKFKRRYGLEHGEAHAMLESQGGRCGICGDPVHFAEKGERSTACVDHCHETGVARGILCFSCNAGIGHFRDSPTRLRGALSYVESHRQLAMGSG